MSKEHTLNSEGITFELFRREAEYVVCIKIKTEPYSNGHGKGDKTHPVIYCRKKGQQKNPEGGIINLPDQGEGVSESLLDCNIVSCVFLKPCEPHGCMELDNYSVKCPDHREPDQSTLCCPE